jgi:phosphoesterase family protein
MSPLRVARTAAALVLISAPVSVAAQALASSGSHGARPSPSAARMSHRKVHVRERVASAGIYDVHVVIRTRRLAANVIHVKIGALSRRATTGRGGRAVIDAHVAIRGHTLRIRAHARWTRPDLTVSLRRVGALKKRPGGKTRASAPSTTGATGATGATSGSTGSTGSTAATGSTGSTTSTGYSHVVVLIEENYDGPAVVGGSSAPYLKGLAGQGEYWPSYHGVSHPSEPNYLALFTGATQGADGSDNCIASSATSIIGEALAAGVSAEGYIEDLASGGALYACRHDPFSQLADATAHETDFTNLPTAFATLPRLSFIVPNTVDDMHDSGIAPGDAWAQSHIDAYAQWAKANNSLLFVISDENDSDPNYNANQPGENGNTALAIAVGAGIVPGTVNQTSFDHYSMLRTVEDIFGLGHLGASAAAADMLAP